MNHVLGIIDRLTVVATHAELRLLLSTTPTWMADVAEASELRWVVDGVVATERGVGELERSRCGMTALSTTTIRQRTAVSRNKKRVA
ncbi:hypothetical protein D3C72_1725730 [compost metagenome]